MTVFYNIIEADANKDEDRNGTCVMEFVNNRAKAEAYAARCQRNQEKYRYKITLTKVSNGE